ncbi:MAG: hypothetical protein OEZ03_03080 [Alphaproteobacteria bacterium]|nr:hypothetical protein [Alphaproteobacteria bacterium]
MKKYAPIDVDGNDLQIGDWVRVLAVPLSIRGMPDESIDAFCRAVGNTLQIEAFDNTGCMELDMWPKVSTDTIWLEPYCVKRSRRYKKLSKAFQRTLELKNAPLPPSYEVSFDLRLKEGADLEAFGHEILAFGYGGGFSSWPDDRRIKGSVHADKSDPDAIGMLNDARRFIAESDQVSTRNMGEIAETGGD